MKGIPTIIRVGPIAYKVDFTLREPYGNTDVVTQTISLHARNAPDQMADTLLHEVFHTIWAQTSLRVWDEKVSTEAAEEAVIRDLVPLLLDTLRRNPKLTKFLLHGAE